MELLRSDGGDYEEEKRMTAEMREISRVYWLCVMGFERMRGVGLVG